jgi:hypothetical protein
MALPQLLLEVRGAPDLSELSLGIYNSQVGILTIVMT